MYFQVRAALARCDQLTAALTLIVEIPRKHKRLKKPEILGPHGFITVPKTSYRTGPKEDAA